MRAYPWREECDLKKSAVVILLLALLLTGCGKGEEPAARQPETPAGYGLDVSTGQWTGEGGSFVLKPLEQPLEDCDILQVIPWQDSLVFAGSRMGEGCTVSWDGKTIQVSGDFPGTGACAGEGGVWLLLYKDGEAGRHAFAELISPEGESLRSIDLDALYEGVTTWASVHASGDRLYLTAYSQEDAFVVVSTSEELLGVMDRAGRSLLQGGDGKIYLAADNGNGYDVFPMDGTSVAAEPAFSCGEGTLCSGPVGGCLLLVNSEGLYRIEPGGSQETVAIWSESGLSVNGIYGAQALPGGRYLLCFMGGSQVLEPVDPSELKPRTRLTLAAYGTGFETEVQAFNRASEDYYIEVLDYSDNGAVDLETAQTRLMTEIIGGSIPDMLRVSSSPNFEGFSPFPFIRRGLAADLTEYISADPEISLEDIAIAKALDMGGHLYTLAGSFCIDTLLARYDRFGDRLGWTLDEYLELEQSLPDGSPVIPTVTRENFLEQLAARYIRRTADWESGKCDFDTQEFISILQAAAGIREASEPSFGLSESKVADGSAAAVSYYIDDPVERCKWQQRSGGVFSTIGWPTPDGSCGSSAVLNDPVLILDQSPNATGCWEFIRFSLLNASTAPGGHGLPVYRPALNSLLEAAQDPALETPMSTGQADQILKLVEALETDSVTDTTLLRLVTQESAALLNGEKGAEEVARAIQSKAGIYMAEQEN